MGKYAFYVLIIFFLYRLSYGMGCVPKYDPTEDNLASCATLQDSSVTSKEKILADIKECVRRAEDVYSGSLTVRFVGRKEELRFQYMGAFEKACYYRLGSGVADNMPDDFFVQSGIACYKLWLYWDNRDKERAFKAIRRACYNKTNVRDGSGYCRNSGSSELKVVSCLKGCTEGCKMLSSMDAQSDRIYKVIGMLGLKQIDPSNLKYRRESKAICTDDISIVPVSPVTGGAITAELRNLLISDKQCRKL
jgi:hypothetical protein